MNKKTLLCMLCIVLTLLLCCCTAKESVASVGILEGLRYGMSPEEVGALLGEAVMTQDETKRLNMTFYSYEVQLDGQRVIATVTFLDDKRMNSVFVYTSCDSEESAQKLFKAWKSREIAAHGEDAWDSREASSPNPDNEYNVSFRSKQNAGSLTVSIAVIDNAVRYEASHMD